MSINYDGWVVATRAEFGEFEDNDWRRVEVESKIIDVNELLDHLQQVANSIGFDYLEIKATMKGETND